MNTEYFVAKESVVRKIWGKSDTILLIFAGASAEFALNKAVDWLYVTGRLPVDPIGRLFSTVSYAQSIVFSEKQAAFRTIDSMTTIHSSVETKRGATIPAWAYRDVLFLLIDYSIRSFEVLERKLSSAEKNDVFQVFNNLGSRMKLTGLPETFAAWEVMRQEHLKENLRHSDYTDDLYNQYKKHLGTFRYGILREAQKLVMPHHVIELLQLRKISLLSPFVRFYKICRWLKLDWLLKALILPPSYEKQIMALDR
ncbi:MAG: DUF2236 domain-containing protein [Cyclobacteriaceae bacterium]|nr:DUF2236 domain-containing protein [Cyclobacteriaceae bacterium]